MAMSVANLGNLMEWVVVSLPHLRIAAARAMNAFGPMTRDEIRLAVIFGLEPSDKFAELHHGEEYNALFGWCQHPDNRHCEEPSDEAIPIDLGSTAGGQLTFARHGSLER